MLNPGTNQCVHICLTPTDMRKSFNSLSNRVTDLLEKESQSGDLFVFFNKNKTMVKILAWDNSGYVIYYKRLENGSFHLPLFETEHISSKEISSSDLLLILAGVELHDSKRHKRFGI